MAGLSAPRNPGKRWRARAFAHDLESSASGNDSHVCCAYLPDAQRLANTVALMNIGHIDVVRWG